MKRTKLALLLVLVLLVLGSACSAAFEPSPAPAAPAAPPAPTPAAPSPAPPQPSPEAPATAAPSAPAPDVAESAPIPVAPAEHPPQAHEGAVALPILTPSDSRGRHLIYTVDIEIQTTTFMPGIRMLLTTLAQLDGYIETALVNGRDMRTPDVSRSARYTMRIQTERLPEYLVFIEDNFNLLLLRQLSQDVTESYVHSEFTLEGLREEEAQLRERLEDPRLSADNRSSLTARLADVLAAIRAHEGHIGALDESIRYSTINLILYEVIFPEVAEEVEEIIEEPYEPVSFGTRLREAGSDVLTNLIVTLQAIAVGIIRILPALLILAVLAIIALKVYRRVKKSQKNSSSNDDRE